MKPAQGVSCLIVHTMKIDATALHHQKRGLRLKRAASGERERATSRGVKCRSLCSATNGRLGITISADYHGHHRAALPHAPNYAEHNILLMSNLKSRLCDIAQRYSSVGTLGSMTDPGVGGVDATICRRALPRRVDSCHRGSAWRRNASKLIRDCSSRISRFITSRAW